MPDFVSLLVISFIFSGILCAPYLSIDYVVGDDEDVARFPVPQGMFTPRISVIRSTDFSGFRMPGTW